MTQEQGHLAKRGGPEYLIFHHFANQRKNMNSIWHIETTDGELKYTTLEIQREVVGHFEAFYKHRYGVDFMD